MPGLVGIDLGTGCLAESPSPTTVGTGELRLQGRVVKSVSTYERAKGFIAAYHAARELVPDEIEREIPIPGVLEAVEGILHGLLQAAVVVGVTTAIGAGMGGIIGAFLGGVGAAPGVAFGGEVGLEVGFALLTWLGVGFLLVAIVSGLGEVNNMVSSAAKRAWGAAEYQEPRRQQETQRAGYELARAVALLIRAILEAIVARLLIGGGEVAPGAVKELASNLRKSRMGTALGDFVETNWKKLVDNPRLRPKRKVFIEEKATGGGSASVPSSGTTRATNAPRSSAAPGPKGKVPANPESSPVTTTAAARPPPGDRNTGRTVLGHFPEYKDFAEKTGDRYFQVPDDVWNATSDPWVLNQKFLDETIARGDEIIIATPPEKWKIWDLRKEIEDANGNLKPNPRFGEETYFTQEIKYLYKKGYQISPDGKRFLLPSK